MVLVAFLGSRLGSLSRNLIHHKQMPRSLGEGQIRKRAGTTPPLAGAPRADPLVVPALCPQQMERGRIEYRSVRYSELIEIRCAQGDRRSG